MTQKEIIEREEGNTSFIWLYLEGTFWKAYERSAYAFHSRVKEFRVLRKESKTLGRDILYLGFPQTAFERNTASLLLKSIDEKTVYATLPMPIDENEFLVWRDAQEVKIASQALITPYTSVIEKAPVYKEAYDILSQVILVSPNISRGNQQPFVVRLKELSYRSAYLVRSLYEEKGEERAAIIDEILPMYDELSFLLQVLTDAKEVSTNTYAMLSENIQSVSRQLSLLQRKAKADVPAG